MTDKVTRAEKLLNKLALQDKCITPAGKDWLVAAIDPFHDTQLKNLQGFPDIETGASLVRCIKSSSTIVKASTLPAGNWDCHFVMWPWQHQLGMDQTVARLNDILGVDPASSSFIPIGGVQTFQTTSGADLNILLNYYQPGTITLGTDFTAGAGRLIGIGFEVTNTTAPLYRQGTAYVYRQMANAEEDWDGKYYQTAGGFLTSGSFSTVRYPPKNPNDIMLLAGSRQWAAEEGAYVVGTFHDLNNPPIAASYCIPAILDGDDIEVSLIDIPYFPNTANMIVPSIQQVGGAAALKNSYPLPAVKMCPIQQGGALFTGLSEQTTLTLNVTYYYETFPGNQQADIVTVATPSAEFDPCVLNIYSHAMGEMPVGVKVGENGLGDWFLGVVNKISSTLAPILSMAPGPVGTIGGPIAKFLADSTSSYMAPPNTRVAKGQGVSPAVKAVVKPQVPPNGRGSRPVLNIPTNMQQLRKLAGMTNLELKAKGYTKAQIGAIRLKAASSSNTR